jgi:hypothetical protein
MRYEIDFFGVLVPTLLWLPRHFRAGAMLRPAFRRAGLYRFVWHRALSISLCSSARWGRRLPVLEFLS